MQRTISEPVMPGSRPLRGLGRLRSLLRRSVLQVNDTEQNANEPPLHDGTAVEDDLDWILSEKSHLNIGEFIVDKQEHVSGLGSSCDVLTAWSLKHHTKVAVKRIRASLLEDKKFAKRLAREIRIWASLKHENVLPLLGYFIEGKKKLPNLVSEWMVNGSLFVYMKTFPRCSFVTCKMLRGIASGLAYLHSQEVVHADLKTQNVLISSDGIPLLADFGLSLTLTESQTVTSTSARGSLRWMAPELFKFEGEGEPPRQNKKTDIWAFGMLAYELLAWKIPFYDIRGDHLVMRAIIDDVLPSQVNEVEDICASHILNWIWDCCLACWRKVNASRPTAMQLGHLWSAATSLEVFESLLVNRDSKSLFDDRENWPLWASDLQTAFFFIGVAAKPGPTNLFNPGEIESFFAYAKSVEEPRSAYDNQRQPTNMSVDATASSSRSSSSTHWKGSPMSFADFPPVARNVIPLSSIYGSPMSIDRQSFRGPFQGSPMAIDHIIPASARPQSLSDSWMSL